MKLPPHLALAALTLALLLLAPGGGARAADRDDKADRLSQNQSYTFSPGYINAAMQRARNILRQSAETKDSSLKQDEAIVDMSDKLGQNVKVTAADKAVPRLLKKSSSSDTSQDSTAFSSKEYMAAPQGQLLMSTDYNINVGNGELAHYEGGRMVSEYINGIKHIYVGFADVGFRGDGTTKPLQAAIDIAGAGDMIIVHSGAYNGNLNILGNSRIFGGFNDSGQRNQADNPTYISGLINVNEAGSTYGATELAELNGLTLSSSNIYINRGTTYFYNTNTDRTVNITIKGDGNLYHNGLRAGSVSLQGTAGHPAKQTMLPSKYVYNLTVSTIGDPKQMIEVEKPGSTPSLQADTPYKWNPYSDKAYKYDYLNSAVNYAGQAAKEDADKTSSLAMKLGLKDKAGTLPQAGGPLDEMMTVRALRNALNESAVAVPIGGMKELMIDQAGFMRILQGVLNNPTREQKQLLESVEAMMQDIKKIEREIGASPELTRAQNDLIQMVANVLLAQAMPDLIKGGEMAGIKDIFKDLDTRKLKVMLDYQEATTPYYESIKKDLMKNRAILQMNNILSKNMLEDELKNASRSQMDEVIQNLKKSSDKFFEKDYILQQEAKYREKYLDPNKKKLEQDTRVMLNEFTKRLSEKLEHVKK